MKNVGTYRTLLLDCDGVILDTNEAKGKLFYDLVLRWGSEPAQMLLDFHKKNGGVSRYQKFEYFFSNILKCKTNRSELEKLCDEFSENSKKITLNSTLTKGVVNFLDTFKDKEKYVVSGADEKELREVFAARDLIEKFDGIFGSPKTKSEIIRNLNLNPETALFIGDSKTDYDAAMDFGCDFLLMTDYSSDVRKDLIDVPSASNFDALLKMEVK